MVKTGSYCLLFDTPISCSSACIFDEYSCLHSTKSLEKFKPELLETSELIGREAGAWSFPEKKY